MDCTPFCRLPKHADVVLSSVTREKLSDVQNFVKNFCANGAKTCDSFGRNALHVAASCGKKEVVKWLLEEGHLRVDEKDFECGWTALHRSCYYGHFSCALLLVQYGANRYEKDFEGITPVELLLLDSLQGKLAQGTSDLILHSNRDKKKVHVDVSSWGTNTNFTLGHGDQKERHIPEVIDAFSRHLHVNICEMVICKFHSVFLAGNGSVWTCGHGQGGRLGHGHEKTILIPKKIDSLANEVCTAIAAAQDHTVFLCENGSVYTCGLNKYHQLGHYPALSQYLTPKQIQSKVLKGKKFIGIAGGNFHTVLYTKKEVFSFGLNAGQLGHSKGDKTQIIPRQVSVSHLRDISIALMACSDAATVALTQNGDIHLLYQYTHKRIISKLLNISKLVVAGGSLDDKDLTERRYVPLVVYGLYEDGKVFQWREIDKVARECYLSLQKTISVRDIACGRGLHIATDQGEVYFEDKNIASVAKPATVLQRNLKFVSYSTALKQNEIIKLSMDRVKHVHRAVKVACDQYSQNFAILQADAATGSTISVGVCPPEMQNHLSVLFESCQQQEGDYDVEIKVKENVIYAHRFILAHASDKLRRLLDSTETELPAIETAIRTEQPTIRCFDDENFDVVREIVEFIYTGACPSLPDVCTYDHNVTKSCVDEDSPDELAWSLDEIDLSELDNFQAPFKRRSPKFREEQKIVSEEKYFQTTKKIDGGVVDDMKQRKELLRVAKKFKINELISRLQSVGSHPKLSQPRFYWNKFPEYHDVVIEAGDGVEYACHKCILAARLEYFSIMLTTTWIESCDDFVHLKMPIDSPVLKVVLDFLYTDEAPIIKESQDLEFLGKVLTIADQLWIIRLKEICEARLASLISLKNAVEMLEFSCLYNAKQLENVCSEFICLNMSYLFEARSLEFLSEETLDELSKAYRDSISSMAWRVITPSDVHLSVSWPQPESPTKQRKSSRKKSRTSESEPRDSQAAQENGTNENGLIKMEVEDEKQACSAVCNGDSELNNTEPDNLAEITINDDEQKEKQKAGWWYRKDKEMSQKLLSSTFVSSSGKTKTVSNPLPIPKKNNDENKAKQPWGSQSCSPQSSDLRAIMEQEISKENTPQFNGQKKEGKSPIGGKSRMSQKERKKLRKYSDEQVPTNNNESADTSTSPTTSCTPVNPWKSCSAVPAPAMSFRALLKDEETQETRAYKKTKAVKIPTHPQTPTSSKTSTRASPSAWQNSNLFCSPPNNPMKFDEIQQLQEEETSLHEKNKKKPLSLIQIEDKAIDELLQHYGGRFNPCEFIEVKREVRNEASPSWVT